MRRIMLRPVAIKGSKEEHQATLCYVMLHKGVEGSSKLLCATLSFKGERGGVAG